MADLSAEISEEFRELLQKEAQPDWMNPMLAKLTHEVFSDEEWIYERKLDGERCLIFKKGKKVQLFSRNQQSENNTYPELVEALEKLKIDFIADGEIVAFKGKITSFAELQKRMHLKDKKEIASSKTAVFLYLFDVMHLEGFNLVELPLLERKKLLRKEFDFNDPIRFTPYRKKDGEKFYKEACHKKWEGLIAKKSNSTYSHGRSSNWMKFKCENQQEFVIGGYTNPQGERKGFGALLIGFYDQEGLQYAGKVGTGFTDSMLQKIKTDMTEVAQENCPFQHPGSLPSKEVHWLQPKMVCEVAFTEWTKTNKLRHPRFLGLRKDKPAKKVVKEM